MATDIVTDQSADSGLQGTEVVLEQPPRYTPEDHEKAAAALKVLRLVELGEGPHGKTATFEFTGGFIRSIDVDAKTVWHEIFGDLEASDWQRLHSHVAARFKAADGRIVIQDGPMSFWTRAETPRGRYLSRNYFDVPDESYAEGKLRGTKAARELILFLKEYPQARRPMPSCGLEREVHSCLKAAFAIVSGGFSHAKPSKVYAADAFCRIVNLYFFAVGASDANPAYLDDQVDTAERSITFWAEREERDRREAAERMRVARAAKAAKRTASHSAPQGANHQVVASSGHFLQ